MAETRRQVSELLTNLPDNTEQLITPEHIRDAILSAMPEFGVAVVDPASLPVVVPFPTTFGVAPVDILMVVSDNFMSAGGPGSGLQYVGPVDVYCFAVVQLYFSGFQNERDYEMQATINGSPVAGSLIGWEGVNGPQTVSMSMGFVMTPNDILNLEVRKTQGSSNDPTLIAGNSFLWTRPQ